MDPSLKRSGVNRIITGIFYLDINGQVYRYSNPTQEQIALSELVYQQTLNDSKYNGLLNRDNLKRYLARQGIWTEKDKALTEDYNKLLDDLKIQLYEALINTDKQKTIRRNIKNLRKQAHKHLIKQFTLDHMTLEYHAEEIRDQFLTSLCIQDMMGNPLYTYENFKEIKDFLVINRFTEYIASSILSTSDYREIARTEPFRSIWSLSKSNLYTSDPVEWTDDQKALLTYSKMYDNVYEHPERPDESVIKDDDMLDGWFVKLKRENEKARQQKEANNLYGNDDGTGDLFIMANNRESAEKVKNLNDIHSKMKMKQRDKAIQENGKLEPHQLPDIKQELQQEAMRQMADRFKK